MWHVEFAAYKTTSSLYFSPQLHKYWHHIVCLTKVLILKKKKKQTANLKLGNDTNQTKTYNLIYQENALHSFLLEC